MEERFVPLSAVPKQEVTGTRQGRRVRIYALVDPEFSDVRYVGATNKRLEERLAEDSLGVGPRLRKRHF